MKITKQVLKQMIMEELEMEASKKPKAAQKGYGGEHPDLEKASDVDEALKKFLTLGKDYAAYELTGPFYKNSVVHLTKDGDQIRIGMNQVNMTDLKIDRYTSKYDTSTGKRTELEPAKF